MKQGNQKLHQRFYLSLLAILFLGPLIVAWSLYSSNKYFPQTLNYGHIIHPSITIQDLALRESNGKKFSLNQGKWLLLFMANKKCYQSCKDVLYKINQLHLALGKDKSRVKPILVTLAHEKQPKLKEILQKQYRLIEYLQIKKQNLNQFQTALGRYKNNSLFLVDPHGNIFMSYPSTESPRGIYEDLQRVLKISQIG